MFCSSCGEKITVQSAEYCPACGANIEEDIYILIKGYFHRGYRYQAIVGLLDKFHGIDILKRYDKLKPYGFPIHGCICGNSRRIIWLDFVPSNNNPKITAGLYLDAVQNLGGCPRIVRSDCGSENVVLAGMQCYFRAECRDEFLGERPTNTAPPPLTKELRDGGHPLEGVDPTIIIVLKDDHHPSILCQATKLVGTQSFLKINLVPRALFYT
ncbi:hypothetical protein QZH41_017856 [Actinostola sp. cb2023]|nr:hypothetical protein QZH41_017856 [Actinostola sp. cb2023]